MHMVLVVAVLMREVINSYLMLRLSFGMGVVSILITYLKVAKYIRLELR